MKTKLYIIGNGFDIKHGLKSSYNDFRDYLMEENEENKVLIQLIDKYEKTSNSEEYIKWSKVEESLGKITFKDILEMNGEDVEEYLPYEDLDEIIYKNDSNSKEIFQKVNEFIDDYLTIKNKFRTWAKGITIDKKAVKESIETDLKRDDYYVLSFNYTNTLEELYEVSKEDILHIHGSQNEKEKEIEFGHGERVPKNLKITTLRESLRYFSCNFSNDQETVFPDLSIMNVLKKDTNLIFEKYQKEFEKYKGIEDIFVYGFSFGGVDKIYLEKLVELCPNANWHIQIYKEEEESERIKKVMNDLKVKVYSIWKEWDNESKIHTLKTNF